MAPERRGAAAPDEDALFVDIVHEAPLSGQRQSRSVVGGTLYCILLTGYAGLAIAAPWIFVLIPDIILPLLCSCNVLLLIVTGIFQQYWVHQVKKVRLQGYYDLSQKLKHIASIPFATIACDLVLAFCDGYIGIVVLYLCLSGHYSRDTTCLLGTAVMLLILVWQPELKILSISVLLRIALVIEVVCAGCFMSLYIGRIHKYNSLNEQPDILQPLYSALRPSSSFEEPRYYDTRLSDQQMALLQYQRDNIHYLSEEVLRLQECLSKYHRTVSASTPQVDLAHILASRDQELRALSAEMNQVHSELHLARGLIAEKDSEIQHIRSNNNQYVEENERLRAILGEWSARAAKLERALEAERVSNIELQKKHAKQRPTNQGEKA